MMMTIVAYIVFLAITLRLYRANGVDHYMAVKEPYIEWQKFAPQSCFSPDCCTSSCNMYVVNSVMQRELGECYYVASGNTKCEPQVNSMTLKKDYWGSILDEYSFSKHICTYTGPRDCPAPPLPIVQQPPPQNGQQPPPQNVQQPPPQNGQQPPPQNVQVAVQTQDCPTNDVTSVGSTGAGACVLDANHSISQPNVSSAPCKMGGAPVFSWKNTSTWAFPDDAALLVWIDDGSKYAVAFETGGGPLLNLNKTVTVPAAMQVTIHAYADDCGDLFVNCQWVGSTNLITILHQANKYVSYKVALKRGCNTIQVISRNLGYAGGMRLCAIDDADGKTVVFRSDETWSVLKM